MGRAWLEPGNPGPGTASQATGSLIWLHPGGPSSSPTDTLPCQLCTLTFPQVEVGQGEQEEEACGYRRPSGRSPHSPYAWVGHSFHLHCSNIYSQTLTEPSEVQWWVSNFCHPQTPGPSSTDGDQFHPRPSIWDLNHNPQPHLLAAASQTLSRMARNQG